MLIEMISPIVCRVDRFDAEKLLPYMSYTGVYYRKIPIPDTKPIRYRQDRREYPKDVFFDKSTLYWHFYSGHLNRLVKEGLPLDIVNDWDDPMSRPPNVNGITLRPDQEGLVRRIRRWKRGVIKAPTGTGKTIMQLALASCYPDQAILVLAHTKDIVLQSKKKFQEYGLNNVVVSTIQSINSKLSREKNENIISRNVKERRIKNYLKEVGVVMVDECHHVSKFDGMYGRVLSEIKAQVRVGFTATTPDDDDRKFALEGLLGPVIGELTMQEAADLGILARPKVRLLRTPLNQRVKEIRKYPAVYEAGVVENETRNDMIIRLVMDNPDKTFLILVTKIRHGEILESLGNRYIGDDIQFVRGQTPGEERVEIKELLKSKSIRCVIATAVWREGVDIPSLDCVINAAGGKSEIMTLQAIGRGLRRTEDKEEVIIYDFFDPSHYYLISHFGQRVTLYMDNNWL
jgi:superfamily II DNA or RNA helicase